MNLTIFSYISYILKSILKKQNHLVSRILKVFMVSLSGPLPGSSFLKGEDLNGPDFGSAFGSAVSLFHKH